MRTFDGKCMLLPGTGSELWLKIATVHITSALTVYYRWRTSSWGD